MKFFKNKKGFTLVELVVVIAILGILAGIAIPRFMDATASARGAKIVADLRTIDSAIMMYQAQGNTPLTAVAATATDTQLTGKQLLSSWPKPPSGNAILTSTSNGGKLTIKDAFDSGYAITVATGEATRATYGGFTADEMLQTAGSDSGVALTKKS